MSAPFAIEYSSQEIATAKEAWYIEETAPHQRRETFESAEELSSLVEEARRRQIARELAEGFREVLEQRIVNENRDLELKFRRLADEWIMETGLLSDPVQKLMHPAHLKIIGLGE